VARHCQHCIAVPIAGGLPAFPARNHLRHLQATDKFGAKMSCQLACISSRSPRMPEMSMKVTNAARSCHSDAAASACTSLVMIAI
jgi:hypothetical protein